MSFPSSSDLRFSIAGPIVSWDQHGRWLRIGVRNFWLSPGVSVAGLVRGAMVTASGHQDDSTARWIVTKLTTDSASAGPLMVTPW